MSFVVKGGGGVTNWSAIVIDTDKNMGGFGLSNMKEVVAAMVGGDLIAKGLGGILVRIPAGVANTVLTSAGMGQVPTWAPGGLYLNRFFPANVYLTKTALIKVPDKIDAEPALLSSPYNDATGDQTVGLGIVKAPLPVIGLTDTESVPYTADQTDIEPAAVHTHFDLQVVVTGGFKSPLTIDTDETAANQSAAANDVTLPPQTPALTDAYKWGHENKFDVLRLNVGTAGVGVWTVTWEYWDGALWQALAGVTDGTNGFHNAGVNEVTFTRPAGWAVQNLGGLGNKYYIRANISAYTNQVTAPLGTQTFIRIIT